MSIIMTVQLVYFYFSILIHYRVPEFLFISFQCHPTPTLNLLYIRLITKEQNYVNFVINALF
jgi:hypothetical protein